MARRTEPQSFGSLTQGIGVLAVVFTVLCWPWVVAFVRGFKAANRLASYALSIASVALAGVFYPVVAAAPAEGGGWYVAIYLACVWIAFPISLLFGRKKQ